MMKNILLLNKVIHYNQFKKFKGKAKSLNWIFGLVDLITIILTYYFAYYIRQNIYGVNLWENYDYLLLLVIMIPLWALILQISNAAKIPRTSKVLIVFFEFVQFTILSLLGMFLIIFIFKLEEISRAFVILFAVFHLAALFIVRISTFKLFKYYRANGYNSSNVVVIADSTSELYINRLLENKEWGFRLLMIISNSKLLKAKFGSRIKIIPDRRSSYHLKSIMEFDIIDEVVYCKRKVDQAEVDNLIKTCEEIGVVFRLQSDLSPIGIAKTNFFDLQNLPFLTFNNSAAGYFGQAWKTLSDLAFSIVILIILSPLMAIIAILIASTSEGPVIFKQVRVGLRGRQFYLYKFRTMVVNAEALKAELLKQNEMDGPAFKMKTDPRITKVGRILRRTGLDEIPQFFNVLKGEMSLIGPRPPLPEEVKKYERWQLRRLSSKPGITCTWQIIPNRNNVRFENWMKLDLAYIDNQSPKLDIILIFKTIKTLFTGTGA